MTEDYLLNDKKTIILSKKVFIFMELHYLCVLLDKSSFLLYLHGGCSSVG